MKRSWVMDLRWRRGLEREEASEKTLGENGKKREEAKVESMSVMNLGKYIRIISRRCRWTMK